VKSPPHYYFKEGSMFVDKLDLKLKEISGVVYDAKSNEFICHNDEKGVVYFLDRETKMIKREADFAGKGDYEDIALVKGSIYILRSDGMLTKILTDSTGKSFGVEVGKVPLAGTNDFETLYYDDNRKALIVICKNCQSDTKKTVSAFAYYPDSSGFESRPVFVINAEEVKRLWDAEKLPKTSHLQPSAAAIHPVLKKLFILSSASNQLVIADTDGNVESVFLLDKKLFPQPEGITFKNNGDMYISNEGVTSKGTLIRFSYRP
jgi:uncharacterized protein YjiK